MKPRVLEKIFKFITRLMEFSVSFTLLNVLFDFVNYYKVRSSGGIELSMLFRRSLYYGKITIFIIALYIVTRVYVVKNLDDENAQ